MGASHVKCSTVNSYTLLHKLNGRWQLLHSEVSWTSGSSHMQYILSAHSLENNLLSLFFKRWALNYYVDTRRNNGARMFALYSQIQHAMWSPRASKHAIYLSALTWMSTIFLGLVFHIVLASICYFNVRNTDRISPMGIFISQLADQMWGFHMWTFIWNGIDMNQLDKAIFSCRKFHKFTRPMNIGSLSEPYCSIARLSYWYFICLSLHLLWTIWINRIFFSCRS